MKDQSKTAKKYSINTWYRYKRAKFNKKHIKIRKKYQKNNNNEVVTFFEYKTFDLALI